MYTDTRLSTMIEVHIYTPAVSAFFRYKDTPTVAAIFEVHKHASCCRYILGTQTRDRFWYT